MTEPTSTLKIRAEGELIFVEVLVVTRASRCCVAGVHDGRLKVMLDAPPVDGRANETLIKFLAKALRRPKRDVTIVRGEKGRQKTLAVSGATIAEVMALVPASSAIGN